MGTGKTVKDVTGTVGGIASMIPGYGTAIGAAISGIGSLVGGVMESEEAQKQAQQAATLRANALRYATDPMRKEYLKKLRMDEMAALSNAPGTDFAKNQIQQSTANQLRAIRESSPSGAATVNAISAALGQRNAQEQQLAAENMKYRVGAQDKVSSDLQSLGDTGMALEERRDRWKREGLQAAAALENAATANRMKGASTIIGSLTSTAAGIGKTAMNQSYVNALNKAYGGGDATTTTGTTTPLIGTGKTDLSTGLTNSYYNTPSVSGGLYLGKHGSELSAGEINDVKNQFDALNMKAASGLASADELEQLKRLRQLQEEYSMQGEESGETTPDNEFSETNTTMTTPTEQ